MSDIGKMQRDAQKLAAFLRSLIAGVELLEEPAALEKTIDALKRRKVELETSCQFWKDRIASAEREAAQVAVKIENEARAQADKTLADAKAAAAKEAGAMLDGAAKDAAATVQRAMTEASVETARAKAAREDTAQAEARVAALAEEEKRLAGQLSELNGKIEVASAHLAKLNTGLSEELRKIREGLD